MANADNPFEDRSRPQADSGVLASEQVMEIGRVIVAGNYRYIITAEISRDEFDRQLSANIRKGGVVGNATMTDESGIHRKDYRGGASPDFAVQHYYRARVEFAKPGGAA